MANDPTHVGLFITRTNFKPAVPLCQRVFFVYRKQLDGQLMKLLLRNLRTPCFASLLMNQFKAKAFVKVTRWAQPREGCQPHTTFGILFSM